MRQSSVVCPVQWILSPQSPASSQPEVGPVAGRREDRHVVSWRQILALMTGVT